MCTLPDLKKKKINNFQKNFFLFENSKKKKKKSFCKKLVKKKKFKILTEASKKASVSNIFYGKNRVYGRYLQH
jgi:hypothetical protein